MPQLRNDALRCARVVVRQASCFWYHQRTITHYKQEKTYG